MCEDAQQLVSLKDSPRNHCRVVCSSGLLQRNRTNRISFFLPIFPSFLSLSLSPSLSFLTRDWLTDYRGGAVPQSVVCKLETQKGWWWSEMAWMVENNGVDSSPSLKLRTSAEVRRRATFHLCNQVERGQIQPFLCLFVLSGSLTD